MFRQIGPTEILIILGVVLLLFGGKKLPELARGSGKALRIFKTEVKALHDDDDETKPASLETVKATEPDKKPEQG
jgi:sec-independent protein translocase protein TatA